MAVAPGTPLAAIPALIAGEVAAYNGVARTARYNITYNNYMAARTAGIAATGSLSRWISTGGAVNSISGLLRSFGMNHRASSLVSPAALHTTLCHLQAAQLDWIAGLGIPLALAPALLAQGAGTPSLAAALTSIYGQLTAPGAVTVSGGFVAASKTLHCLFPELAPMIDGAHTGLSYFNIDRATYMSPTGSWTSWLGGPLIGLPNPSPRGAGRNNWGPQQFLLAIGINQHIYDLWQVTAPLPSHGSFLAIDPTLGTTGVPRIIDKVLW